MDIFLTRNQIVNACNNYASNDQTIGFVPTMGALHEGHLSLVKRAKAENEIIGASIFVNPLQFNNSNDLKLYPRLPEKDIEMLEQMGCNFVFMPSNDELYKNWAIKQYALGMLEQVYEGLYRPGHFQGVANVVDLLFSLIQPTRAYFGLKDLQQVAVIKKLVQLQGYTIDIITCETLREMDGLAMSSRNMRLLEEQRKNASFIFNQLQFATTVVDVSIDKIKVEVIKNFSNNLNFKLDYFDIVDVNTFERIDNTDNSKNIAAIIAAYMGDVRLIDNMFYNTQ